jgi:hypothetical protein
MGYEPLPREKSGERLQPKVGSQVARASDTTHELALSRRPTRR